MKSYECWGEECPGKMLGDFMKWALTDGQRFAPELGYAPLPKEVVAMEMEALKRIKI